jgi:4-amino-4-deoxy-L-arabinose transferase-like glycosyltransferase
MSHPVLHFLGGVLAVLSIALAAWQTWLWWRFYRRSAGRRVAALVLALFFALGCDAVQPGPADLAVPAIVVLCVSILWWWFRRKKRRPPPPAPTES